MGKKPNEIHETLIPMKIKNLTVQYTTNINIPYNWLAFLAASWLNSGYTSSSYTLIRIRY